MSSARAWLRLVALAVTTTPVWLGLVASKPVTWIHRRLGLRLEGWWLRHWARTSAAVVGLRIASQGPPPKPPFFLVCNHLSYLDIVVLLSLVDGRFLAKSEIARWPVMGLLARTTGTLFIERTRPRDLARVLPAVTDRLDAGAGVIVFPEGTSTRGDAVLPFKPGIFEVAVRTSIPVSCAALRYRTPPHSPPAHLSVCWWGDTPFVGHFFRLLALPRIEATVAFGGQPITAGDRKALAARAQEAVSDHFTPLVGCEA